MSIMVGIWLTNFMERNCSGEADSHSGSHGGDQDENSLMDYKMSNYSELTSVSWS